MREVLEALCNYLDDELERQGNVLALCTAQREALNARDIAALNARTEALDAVASEALDAERRRRELVALTAASVGIDNPDTSLRHVAQRAPEPWGSRLEYQRGALARILGEIRTAVYFNASRLRNSLQVVNQALAVVAPGVQESPGYDAPGQSARTAAPRAAVIDQRG